MNAGTLTELLRASGSSWWCGPCREVYAVAERERLDPAAFLAYPSRCGAPEHHLLVLRFPPRPTPPAVWRDRSESVEDADGFRPG